MGGASEIFRKAGLFFASALFSLSLSLLVAGMSATVLLYPEPYLASLERNNAYERVWQSLQRSELAPLAGVFSAEDIRVNAERLIPNVLAYIRSDSDTLDMALAVDSEKLKEEGISLPDSTIDIQSLFQAQPGRPGLREDLQGIREAVRWFRAGLVALAVIALASLAAIFLLNRKSVKAAARAAGTGMLFVGMGAAFSALVASETVLQVLSRSPVAEAPTLVKVIADITGEWSGALLMYALAVLAGGAALMVFSFLKREKGEAVEEKGLKPEKKEKTRGKNGRGEVRG